MIPLVLVNGARGVITKFLSTRNPSVRFDNGVEQTMRLEVWVSVFLAVAIAYMIALATSATATPPPPPPERGWL